MNILLIGGAKTERISEALEKCFSTGSANFLCEKGIDDFERFYDAGYYFERGVIIDYGIAFGHNSYDIRDNRERLNKFLDNIQKRSRSTPKLVFVCGTESMAEMVNQEIQVLSGYATVLFVKPPYSVTFMVEAASSQFEELYRYSYAAWLKQKEAEEQAAQAEDKINPAELEDVEGFGDIPVELGGQGEEGAGDGEEAGEQFGDIEVTDLEGLFGGSSHWDEPEEPGAPLGAEEGSEEGPEEPEGEEELPVEQEDHSDWAELFGQAIGTPDDTAGEIPVEAEAGEIQVDTEENVSEGQAEMGDMPVEPEEPVGEIVDASDLFGAPVEEPEEAPAGPEELFVPQAEPVDEIPVGITEVETSIKQEVQVQPQIGKAQVKEKRGLFGRGKKQSEPKVKQPKAPKVAQIQPKKPMVGNRTAEDTLRAVMNTYKLRGHLITVTGAGGTGKTTIVNSLADMVSNMGYSVLMADFDVYHRGLSYNSLENYEAVHALDTGRSQLIEALKTGAPIQSVASIVRPGKHLLSSGLASDLSPKIFEPEQVSRLSSGSKGQYQVILIDVPWDLLVGPCSKLLYNSDDIVIAADMSTEGLMELMLNMCNIPDEEMAQLLWTTSKLCLTKVGEATEINLVGTRARNVNNAMELLDRQLTSILGEEAEYSFRKLHRTSEVPYDSRYKAMVMGRQLPNSIPEIRETYMRLLESIITNE